MYKHSNFFLINLSAYIYKLLVKESVKVSEYKRSKI